MKTYVFVDEATGAVSVSELLENDPELQEGQVFKELGESESKLSLRYEYVNGEIVDQYVGQTDEMVMAKILADHEVAVQAPKINDLDLAKKVKLQAVRTYYNNIVETLKSDVAPYEVATWDVQRIEYADWLKDKAAITPYVTALAAGRGMSVDDLMVKIGVRVTALANLQGAQQALEVAVQACATAEEVEAIKIA